MTVILRNLREEHLPLVMEWRMRPYITRYMNTDPKLTLEKQKQWYAKVKNDPHQIHWVVEADGVLVGVVNIVDIDRQNKHCLWGYYIAEKKKRSLDLATSIECNIYDYAFDVLGMEKLRYETFAENWQVVKLHQLCGSKEEGVLRKQILKSGVFYDMSVGSILREEWEQEKADIPYDKFEFEMGGGCRLKSLYLGAAQRRALAA